MQKIILTLLTIALLSTTSFSQKTINDANAEKRTVSSFHGIDIGTGIECVLTEGKTEELAVSADKPEYRNKIVTKVENGILKIHYETKPGAINTKKETKNLRAYISYKSLDKLFVSTGASVKMDGVLQSSSLEMKANTGALVKGKVQITSLKVSQSTGSKITLTGAAEYLEIDGSTGSQFSGLDLASANCDISVSTGANITVNANKELQVKANTGGVVKYKGNASLKEIKKNTGGTVSKI